MAMPLLGPRERAQRRKDKITEYMIYLYFALTFFEPYLNGVLGSVTKYYVLLLILIVTYNNELKIRLRPYIVPYVIWLAYLFVSLLWTDRLRIYRLHSFSQIGMIGLLVALTMRSYEKRIIDNIVKVMWTSSFIISLLAMFFGNSYHDAVETRQVLVLFGVEIDPNNQAAFALVGISIALYYLIYEKKYIVISIGTLLVNAVSMFMTGSRGGLVSLVAVALFIFFFDPAGASFSTKIRNLAMLAIGATVLLIALQKYIPEDILDRLTNVDSYESGSERTIVWENGLKLLFTNLNVIFGAGWGDYYGYNGFYKAMHNTYLAMLCDVGVLGFSLFFVPVIQKIRYAIRTNSFLPVLLLLAGLCPSFFIDAINKRIFWNPTMFLFIWFIYETERTDNETQIEVGEDPV